MRSAAVALLLAWGCEPGAVPSVASDALRGTPSPPRPRYLREWVFLGRVEESPLVVPFVFEATEEGDQLRRDLRAWRAQGSSWQPILRERWRTPGATGVWRALPYGRLRLSARGASELESLWLEDSRHRLRLDLGTQLSSWNQESGTRYRVLAGRLRLGEEQIPGAVLETLQVLPPAGSGRGRGAEDWIFLTSGDTLRLLVAHRVAKDREREVSFGWTGTPAREQPWNLAAVDRLDQRPLEGTRASIPLRWRFRIAEAGLQGEVRALGYDTVLGAERAGGRPVEVRYSVAGWVEVDGRRAGVRGAVRHLQE